MNTWVKVACMVGLVVAGFAGGWASKGGSVAKAKVKVADKVIQQDQRDLDKRVADEHDAAVRARELLQFEQGKTADLNTQLLNARATTASLQDEISHAQFQSNATPAVLGLCPGSPYVDPAYMQLYERAATGHVAPGTGDPTGYPSGVLARIFQGLPGPAGGPAAGLGDHDRGVARTGVAQAQGRR